AGDSGTVPVEEATTKPAPPAEAENRPGNPPQPLPDEPVPPPQGELPQAGNINIQPVPLPEVPVFQPPALVTSQLDLLVVNDLTQGNAWVTTLSSNGATVSGSAPAAIFGVLNPGGRHRYPVAWYPHNNNHDVQRFIQAQPASAFAGLLNNQAEPLNGELPTLTLPSGNYVNPLFSHEAVQSFINGQNSTYTLQLQEQLVQGGERHIEAMVAKKAQITLQRPAQIVCKEDRVDGLKGVSCLVRTVEVTGSDFNSGDIQFIIRSNALAGHASYRAGQQWYPVGTPIPISEFAQSKGIELFLSDTTQQQEVSLQQQRHLSTLLEAGFYSMSRHQRGDAFGLAISGRLPADENPLMMSRIEIATIDDQVTQNQYVTTLSSQSRQRPAPLLYGLRTPDSGARPAIWYSKREAPATRATPVTGTVQLNPAEIFSGFADEGGAVSDQTSFSPALSQQGWQKLLSMMVGDAQLWRYEKQDEASQQILLSHIFKQAQLTLSYPDSKACRQEQVEGVEGRVCTMRKVEWQGAVTTEDIRFALSNLSGDGAGYYRVSDTWIPFNASVPLAEFTNSNSIEFFIPAATSDDAPVLQPLLQMQFFSSQRIGQGDKFVIQQQRGLPELPDLPIVGAGATPPPLQINQLSARKTAVIAGEPLNIEFELNRPILNGETLRLLLKKRDNNNRDAIFSEQALLEQQSIPFQENRWLILTPDSKSSRYQLTLPTRATAGAAELELYLQTGEQSMARSMRSAPVGDAPRSEQMLQLRVSPSPLLASDELLVTGVLDGVNDSAIFPARATLLLPLSYSPLKVQPGTTAKLSLTRANTDAQLYLTKFKVFFYPSGQSVDLTGLVPSTTIPQGTTNFRIEANVSGMTFSQIVEKAHLKVSVSMQPEGSNRALTFNKDVYMRLLGHNYGKNIQIKNIIAQSEFLRAGDEIVLFIESENIPADETRFALTCANDSTYNNLSSLVQSYSNDTQYQVYYGSTLLGSHKLRIGTGVRQIPRTAITDPVNKLKVTLKLKKDVKADTVTAIKCKIEIDKEWSWDMGIFYNKILRVVSTEESDYQINQFTATQDLVERTVATAVMSAQPLEAKTLYYKIEPVNLYEDEKKRAVVSFHDTELTGTNKWQGSVTIDQFDRRDPQFTIKVNNQVSIPGQVRFILSTLKDFSASATKTTHGIMQYPHVEIQNKEDNKIEAPANTTLVFPVEFNRVPLATETLLFDIMNNSGDPAVADILDLTKVSYTIGEEGQKYPVDLSNPLSLSRLASSKVSKLKLEIPAKMPDYPFAGKKFTLSVKVKEGGSHKPFEVTIRPFEEKVSIAVAEGSSTHFNGQIGKEGEVTNYFIITWRAQGKIDDNAQQESNIKQQVQQRALRTMRNLKVTVKGTPVTADIANKERYCALTLADDSKYQIPLPAFLTFTEKGAVRKIWHGCRDPLLPEVSLQNADWSTPPGTGDDLYLREMRLGIGVDFSDDASHYTLAAAGQPARSWHGTAEMTNGEIVVAPVLP
ncbi:MAG: hypothetical protein ACRC5A_10150, partial [Enterobacteriaceae bacterium]